MCLHQSSPLRRREDAPGTLSLVMSFGREPEPRAHRHPAVSASPLAAAGAERSSLPAESSSCAQRRPPGFG